MRALSMIFFAVITLLITTFALIADQAAQAKKTDAEKLIGTWRVVQGRCDGEDLPKEFLSLMRLTFGKGLSQFSLGSWRTSGKFKTSGRDNIELALVTVGSDDPVPALYKLEATGQLAICANLDASGPRPTFFTAEKSSGRILLILERATPGQATLSDAELAKHRDTVNKLKGFERLHENLRRWASAENLHEIGVAFHTYLDDHKFELFLPHAIYTKDGKTPLLSWRVLLLDCFESEECSTKDFRLDEPWDSEHNKKMIPKLPNAYAPPGQDKKSGLTYYQVFTGPGTMFDGNKKQDASGIAIDRGGAFFVIEAGSPVIWTKPEDIELPADNAKFPRLGGLFKDGMNVLYIGGNILFMGRDIEPVELRKRVSPKDK